MCRTLLPVAQQALYGEISLDCGDYLQRRLFFSDNSTVLHPTMARMLEANTYMLRLHQDYPPRRGRNKLDHLRVRALLEACNPNRLKVLKLHFRDPEDSNYNAAVIDSFRRCNLRVDDLYLKKCDSYLFLSLVTHLQDNLQHLECWLEWSRNHQYPAVNECDKLSLSKLRSLSLGIHDEQVEFVSSFIEQACKHLQDFTLQSFHLSQFHSLRWPFPSTPKWSFPALRRLKCYGIPNEILVYIITKAPKLVLLDVKRMGKYEHSLLEMIPPRIERLSLRGLEVQQDPLDTLVDRISSLTGLKRIPLIGYASLNKDDLPYALAAKAGLLTLYRKRRLKATP